MNNNPNLDNNSTAACSSSSTNTTSSCSISASAINSGYGFIRTAASLVESGANLASAMMATTASITNPTATNSPVAATGSNNLLDQQQQLQLQQQQQQRIGNRPKTWAELKAIVNEFRRQILTLSCLSPMNIKFRTLADGRVRIYFLSIPPHGCGDTTLIWVDVGPDEPSHEMYPRRCVQNDHI